MALKTLIATERVDGALDTAQLGQPPQSPDIGIARIGRACPIDIKKMSVIGTHRNGPVSSAGRSAPPFLLTDQPDQSRHIHSPIEMGRLLE